MQIDKLVQLLESPVFVHLRLQLLNVESPHHAPLLKSCYGLLMLLPQSEDFRSLNDRLTTVCNFRDNLGIPPTNLSTGRKSRLGLLSKRQYDLLTHFDMIMNVHRSMHGREMQQSMITGELLHDGMSRSRNISSASASAKVSGRVAAGVGNGSTSVSTSVGASPAPNRGRVTQEV